MDQRFYPTRDRSLWQGLRQISRSRLAHRSDPPRMHFRALVFLYPFALYLATAGGQRFHQWSFHCAGRVSKASLPCAPIITTAHRTSPSISIASALLLTVFLLPPCRVCCARLTRRITSI